MEIKPGSVEQLILDGIVEVAGIDLETGEMLYSMTDKNIKDTDV